MVKPFGNGNNYILKQLEYVTKDHIAYTTLFKLKTALFFSSLVAQLF